MWGLFDNEKLSYAASPYDFMGGDEPTILLISAKSNSMQAWDMNLAAKN
jgi:hypothetical protein